MHPGRFGEVPGSTRLADAPLGRDRADPHRVADAALLVHAPCPCRLRGFREFSVFWLLRLKFRVLGRAATFAAGVGLL